MEDTTMKHTALAMLVLLGFASAAAAQQEIDVFITDYMGKQEIGEEKPIGKQKTDTVSIFAAQGEYEPL